MPNGFESFASNAIALGDKWRERRQTRKLAAAMGQFDTDPQAAVQGVTAVDPVMGYNMRRQITSDAQAQQEAKRTLATETLKTVTGLLRPAAEMPGATPESVGQAYDAVVPMLSQMGMQPGEIAQWKQMVVANPSILQDLENKLQVVPPGAAVVRGGREVYRNAMAPKTLMVKRGDGGTDVITIDPSTGQPMAGGPAVGPAPAATANGGPATVDQAWAFTRPHEGGYAPRDANGAPVNFGINQAAHPEVDVRNITEDQAKGIFQREYFEKSGADKLPGPLGVMHADTFYINPKRAQEFLQQSGGDPQKYLQLRQAWQQRLVSSNPKKYGRYANAWNNRNADLADVITGADAPAAAGGSGVKPIYSTPGKPGKAGGAAAHILTPEEVAAAGLNPTVKWQINHLGDYVMVGPAAQLSRANTQKQQIFGSIQDKTQRMKDAVDELIRDPGLDRAAGFNSYFPTVRGGESANFEAKLEALKSQIGFSVLQDMRQMSPTGGALGNVSNYENKILQNSLNSLDLSQSPAQLRRNLQAIRTYADKLEQRYKRAYNIDFSKAPSQQQGGTAVAPREAIDMLRSNPSPQRRQQFDQIFGNGAAAKALSGKKTSDNNFSRLMPVGEQTSYGTRL